MLSEEIIDKVVERLVSRIEEGNEYILKQIGKNIEKIGTLTLADTHNLEQIIKYGGDYDKIVKKLSEITKLNVKDIHKIFEEVAKKEYEFAEQFYKYRNIKYIPYEQNEALKNQVQAIEKITAQEYKNIMNTDLLGFSVKNLDNKFVFKSLKDEYIDIMDRAIISVTQGKTTFDEEMRRVINELGLSGIKKVDYESGRSVRLDSIVRMHLKDSIRTLHNETQRIIGKEIDADGWEISVHSNPAPDHMYVQGKQFSNKEFEKFQNDKDSKSYDGVFFPAVSEETGHDRRAIGQYNCYHSAFSIVLGVNKQQYTNEQLQKIIDDNNKGFDFEGKHYTMYEGTQLQRQLETEIRKQKDLQIIGREAGESGIEQVAKSQNKITILNKKYRELCEASGLPTKLDRLKVAGYKRVAKSKL